MKKIKILLLLFILPILSGTTTIDEPIYEHVSAHIEVVKKDVFYYKDSLCAVYGVPKDLVTEIGRNESRWRCSDDLSHVVMCGIDGEDSRGDLQVNMKYIDYHNPNGLPLTRLGLLEVAIMCLKRNYQRYGSWRKARFVYARGHWRSDSTWTALEQRFMADIEWNKYDSFN